MEKAGCEKKRYNRTFIIRTNKETDLLDNGIIGLMEFSYFEENNIYNIIYKNSCYKIRILAFTNNRSFHFSFNCGFPIS